MSLDLRTETVTDLAARVRSRELGARELVAHSLARIEALDPTCNAFVAVDGELALADAAALDERLASGAVDPASLPLAGIPLGVKDLEDAAGFRTTFGSAVHAGTAPATVDSTLVARLRDAGCIVVGKTNTPEHGFQAETDNPLVGPTRNPWGEGRSPGGSSGGSAAAIAAGMVPLATGSDGGGSIRIPSALCGLSGIKCSQGRVPLGGAAPPSSGLFSVKGPMARRIRDVHAALLPAIGPDPTDPFCLPPPHEPWTRVLDDLHVPARVLWAPDMGARVDTEVRRVLGGAVDALADLGTEVIEVGDPLGGDPTWPWWVLWTTYMLRLHEDLLGTPAIEQLTPALRDQVTWAAANVTAAEVARSLDAIHHHNLALARALEQAPLLLCPVTAGQTPRTGAQGTIDGVEDPFWVRFTYPFNLTRNPAGTVCAGLTADGMPVGLQVVGPQHADIAVLRTLAALEDALAVDALAPVPA